MKYQSVHPYTKEEAKGVFARGTSAEIIDALLGITYYVKDWQWVQTICLTLLDCSDTQIQWVAIQCLGHLATFHQTLDLALVLPALQGYESNPILKGVVSNAFDDIAMAIKFAPTLVENWDELPRRIKEVLIEEKVLDSHGKLIKKRTKPRQKQAKREQVN